MAETTGIGWTDSTFNPWIGCTRVSPACDDCYAARSTPARAMGIAWGAGMPRHRTGAANWRQPLLWDREHEAFELMHGRRRRAFCASLADVFDNEVPAAWRADLFALIEQTPHLDWLLLTKRIGNVRAMMVDVAASLFWMEQLGTGSLPPNVWLGATVVDQEEADRDIPKLLKVPAAVRFLSIEPMLGPIALNPRWLFPVPCYCCPEGRHRSLAWVIAGGESGPHARPSHPDWFRSLRDQCRTAGVAFFFKQWGEWLPAETEAHPDGNWYAVAEDGSERELVGRIQPAEVDGHPVLRVGTKAAGCLLDGQQHHAFPAAPER